MTAALEGGQQHAPGALYPPGKDPVPILQETEWGPTAGLEGAEILVPTGIRSWSVEPGSSVTIPTELPSPLPDIERMVKIRGMSNVGMGSACVGGKNTLEILIGKPKILNLRICILEGPEDDPVWVEIRCPKQ